MTSGARRPLFSGHVVFGLVVATVGVIFTLDNLDVIRADDYLRYWPAIFILVGLAKLTDWRSSRSGGTGGLVFLAIGSWLLLEELRLLHLDFLQWWPLLLVVMGAAIIWQGVRGRVSRPEGAEADAVINGVAVLSGIKRRTSSQAFRGGELTAVAGGCEVDLRQAAVAGDAVINVFAMWGGISILVPETWIVIDRVTPFLGGYDDHTRTTPGQATQRLTVRGTVIMGGVEIKN